MRGAWSTAAQLRACRCRACHALPVRPVTTSTVSTASNPRRRKALASDVFTACYTAIMATAAVFDSRKKDKRRRNLDYKIAQAKSTLSAMLERSTAHDLAHVVDSPFPDLTDSRPLDKDTLIHDLCKLQPGFLRLLPHNRNNRHQVVQRVRRILGLKWTNELPDARKSTLERCEEVLNAEEKECILAGREPKTETQMEKTTAMITDLVDGLMAEAWWATENEAPGLHPKPHSPDSASTMIRMLRSDGYPRYAHPSLDPAHTVQQRNRLNEVNLKIMEQWVSPYRERLVAKICYNLLVCGVPPGIKNYNLLILCFSALGEHDLSQVVVDSFLHLSHMTPTEATYLCLLHHYRLKGDIVGFHSVLRRMFGYDPRGIGLMRRTADYVARYRSLREWAATQDVSRVRDLYIQRAPLTQDVAEAIMEGLIDFGMLREGAKLLAVCLQERWMVSRDLLWRLFHTCLTLLDTNSIRLIVRALLDNMDQVSEMLLGNDPKRYGFLVRQIHHIVTIFQATTLPGQTPNANGADSGPDNDFLHPTEPQKRMLDHLATAIWIRETSHNTVTSCWWLRHACKTLSDKDAPLFDRLDRVDVALNLSGKRAAKMAKTIHLQRVSKLDWLVNETKISAHRIRNAENIICRTLAKQTPRQLRTRAQFDMVYPIADRISRALPYGTPGTFSHAVANCFRASKTLDARIKLTLVEALPVQYARMLKQAENDSGDVPLRKVMAYFEYYLTGLQTREAMMQEALVDEEEEEQQQQETENHQTEGYGEPVEGVEKADPFARLLERIPRPGNLVFWKKKSATTEGAGY
ncbi:hypothetical protein VTJ83DRAFT_6607 [Remersonia thermophila]|uniref:Pentatricopeptide repeat domain-containing protein n=1 Tax=Remersonia thermophila TaxID=72144 RepID=A0ABR4D571_9PEZI